MSNTTRRRSRTLRLVLAAVALLGIGAAITAAAWQDDVFVDVDINSGDLDLVGQVTIDDNPPSDWEQSDTVGNIQLEIILDDIGPGDEHTVTVALRNDGTADAHVTFDASNVTGTAPGTCGFEDPDGDLPGDTDIAGGATVSWTFTLTAQDWGPECQNQTFIEGYVIFHATTDA